MANLFMAPLAVLTGILYLVSQGHNIALKARNLCVFENKSKTNEGLKFIEKNGKIDRVLHGIEDVSGIVAAPLLVSSVVEFMNNHTIKNKKVSKVLETISNFGTDFKGKNEDLDAEKIYEKVKKGKKVALAKRQEEQQQESNNVEEVESIEPKDVTEEINVVDDQNENEPEVENTTEKNEDATVETEENATKENEISNDEDDEKTSESNANEDLSFI